MKKIRLIIKKVWNDKVGSILIATFLISAISAIWIYFKSKIQQISFIQSFETLKSFLNTEVTFRLFWFLIIGLSIFFIYLILKKKSNYIFEKINKTDQENKTNIETEYDLLPNVYFQVDSDFFYSRFCTAFPSSRGLVWFKNSKEATHRLCVMLQDPLVFKTNEIHKGERAPIWWFRGNSNNSIKNFTKLNRKTWLMNRTELRISKIAAYRSNSYSKCFIYVETEPMKQTGLYKMTFEDIDRQINEFGYSWEEFAIIKGKRIISRSDFDDGSTIINGKVIEFEKAELRSRYLSKYNFLIAPNDSPINRLEIDQAFCKILDDILVENDSIESIVEIVEKSRRKEY